MTMTTRKTTTDPSLASHRLRPRLLGAAIALLVLVTACSSDDSPEAAPTTATAGPTTTAAGTESPAATVAPPVPAELLATALATYADGYEFSTTTSVNDQNASTQTGRWLEGASQLTVESGDGVVEFIITDAGQWTRLPGEEWEELEGAASTAYPLEGMNNPESITLVSTAEDRTTVLATYTAADVGLSGDPVDVTLVFADGNLVGFSFTADLDGTIVSSDTSLAPLTDTSPITAPTG
jgi:hypothetical protein